MEYQNVIVVILMTVAAYYLRSIFTDPPSKHLLIREACRAKKCLISSSLLSRTRSNQHLHFTFGISNPFTNSDNLYHTAFRKAIHKTINFNGEKWQKIKNIAFEA